MDNAGFSFEEDRTGAQNSKKEKSGHYNLTSEDQLERHHLLFKEEKPYRGNTSSYNTVLPDPVSSSSQDGSEQVTLTMKSGDQNGFEDVKLEPCIEQLKKQMESYSINDAEKEKTGVSCSTNVTENESTGVFQDTDLPSQEQCAADSLSSSKVPGDQHVSRRRNTVDVEHHCGEFWTRISINSNALKIVEKLRKPEKRPGSYLQTDTKVEASAKNRLLGEKKKYNCDVCHKVYSSVGHLQAHHTTIHSDEKPHYKCEVCGRSFHLKYSLRVHLHTHLDKKPFTCEVCGKSFARKYNLRIHVKLHTGERTYKCDACGKGFSDKMERRKHFLTHKGEKVFKCYVCSNTYTTKSYLLTHLATHADERPHDHQLVRVLAERFKYRCDVCNKMFAYHGVLLTHLSTHIDGKLYTCDACGKQCSQKLYLEKHTKGCRNVMSAAKVVFRKFL